MSDRFPKILLWLAAAAALAIGAALSGYAARHIAASKTRLTRELHDLDTLRAVEADLRRYEAAWETFQKGTLDPPISLVDLLPQVLPEVKAEEMRDLSVHSVPGWMIRRKEITLGQAPLGKAMEFVRRAEAPPTNMEARVRPPWRLAKCVLRASSADPGIGQAVLIMETVEREDQSHDSRGSNPEKVLGAVVPPAAGGAGKAAVSP